MIGQILTVALHLLIAVGVAAIFTLGFAFLIFLGDANARGKAVVSKGFDWLAMLAIYLSWFALLWRFGFSPGVLMIACAATVVLCLIYVASYNATLARQAAG